MTCLWKLGIILLCEYIVSAAALAFTTRASTSRRLCILCLLVLATIEIPLLSNLPGPELLRGVIAFSCIVKLVHFISLFLILEVELSQLTHIASSSYFSRFRVGLNCVTSTRGIGTPWEVNNWPHFREIPKGQFVAKAIITLGWQYLALDLLNFGALKYFHRNWPDALSAGAEFLSLGSTKEQLMARFPLCCILGANLRLLFAMVYGFLAAIFVLLELSSVKDWPPLFGSLRRHLHILSIRSFWSKFWHQLLRWPLVTLSVYIRRELRLCNSSSRKAQKITELFLVFSLSGFLHVLSAAYAGVPDSLGAIFLFFITNPVVITLEDIYRTRVGGTSQPQHMALLGFLWQISWLYVCVPWFAYPALRLPVKTNVMMPFSFVEEFGSQAVIGAVASGWILSNFMCRETT